MDLLITLAIAAACLLVGLVHWRLAGLAPVWPGAVVPALWLVAVVVLVATGLVDSLVDVGGVVLVTVVLARVWHDARRRRASRTTAAATPAGV